MFIPFLGICVGVLGEPAVEGVYSQNKSKKL
jgi:hypothetical protein